MRMTKLALFACLMAVLAACSSFEPTSDVDRVKARAQARMDAMLAKDMKEAYALMTPGYRSTHNLQVFTSTMGGGVNRLVSADARTATCEEDVCTVLVYVQYRYASGLVVSQEGEAYERVNHEKWIKVDGKWWFVSLT